MMIEEDELSPRRSSMESAADARSRVDRHLPFRSRILDQFFLFEPGDRATVALLMRGMPVPVTFGFPDTDGTLASNFLGFARNFHPSISIAAVHPLCPFSPKERAVVFLCSVAFNFLWTAFTTYHEARVEGRIRDGVGYRYVWLYALVKHAVTVAYAVAIRQVVICPCLYAPVLRAACDPNEGMVRRAVTKTTPSSAGLRYLRSPVSRSKRGRFGSFLDR